jgi:hypothetical protein
MNPIDVTALATQVGQVGPLFAFMMVVILALFTVAIYLYRDGRAERKETTEALGSINVTLASLKELLNAIAIRKS